jgi:hypothetical protein
VGSGFKTFSPGNVLTASDVNNYFMEQAVMSFADSAARTSQIGTANFEEGMLSYLQDTDRYEAYNGTAWVALGTLAGDTGGLVHINTITFSGATSAAFENIFSATYDNYRITIDSFNSAAANDTIFARLRVSGADNTTSNYKQGRLVVGAGKSQAFTSDNNAGTDKWTSVVAGNETTYNTGVAIDIFTPFATKTTQMTVHYAGGFLEVIGCVFKATTSFTGVTFHSNGGNNISGTARIYGYKN